ncbi:hypothetical protein NXS19_008051 [Fusarium pseudograminearum]|nr:hypothetical protein NXS19_008051 [Fusarium pseudograminearum]
MRFYTASLFLPLLPGVTAWAFPSHSLNRREAFELTEREDSGGDKGWIVPANVTVEDWDTAEPGDDWIPVDEVNIGRKLTDYGCAASIRKPIEESLNMLCRDGFCDQSISYVRTIDWLDNGFGSGMSRRKLIVDIKGNYRGSRTKGNVIEAAKRIVNPDSVSHAKRSLKIDSTTCLRYGICKIVTCDMSKFANFISITKFEDPATYISIDMHIRMNESNNHCIARGVLSAIGGAISGIAGGFFGIADALTPGC